MKTLDRYILKTFFSPFLLIFSILFFIFTVQLAWAKLGEFAGKGLSNLVILEMITLLGVQFIPLIVPLTILLAAIMCFGGFGERYELAAIKSVGVSLVRIMAPLFLFTCLISVSLFFFTDTFIPKAEVKARNLSVNVLRSKPALNIMEGSFTEIPGFDFRVKEKYGEDGNKMRDVFIRSISSASEDQRTIKAKEGVFRNSDDKRYLVLELFDGEYYVDQRKNKTFNEIKRQPNASAKFDTLIQYFDISELIQKNMDDKNINNYYRFFSTKELFDRIDELEAKNVSSFKYISEKKLNILGVKKETTYEKRNKEEGRFGKNEDKLSYFEKSLDNIPTVDSLLFDKQKNTLNNTGFANYLSKEDSLKIVESVKTMANSVTNTSSLSFIKRATSWKIDTLSNIKKKIILNQVQAIVNGQIKRLENDKKEISELIKTYAKHKFKAHENFAFPLTCIIFFLIGAPLGSIIRKGGIGTPVVVAMVVFTIYYFIYTFCRNLAKGGEIDAAWAAWLANIVLLPIAIWFTYKSLQDSEVFNVENYLGPFKKFFRKLNPSKNKEHSRYQ